MIVIQLNLRQLKIIDIVKEHEPITSEQIAAMLNLTRATLRPDLAILTMTGILDARPKVGYFFAGIDENNLISKKLKSKLVRDVMSIPILISEDSTIYNGIVTMFLEDTGSIYVTNNGFLSGVVSRKDLLKSTIGGSDINKLPVGLIMTRMPNVVVTFADESISSAAKKIIEHEVDGLPVVEKETAKNKDYYRVIGRISKTNITRLFVELSGE